jgi:hypothetical protein
MRANRLLPVIATLLVVFAGINTLAQTPAIWAEEMEDRNLEKIFSYATKIQTNKEIYVYLNGRFAEVLQIAEERQKAFDWTAQTKGLSESQIVAILEKSPRLLELLERYLPAKFAATPDTVTVEAIKVELDKLLADPALIAKLKILADPTVAYTIRSYQGKPAISSVETFVNHPTLYVKNGQSVVQPASNLKQVVIDFIRGSKTEVWANFFDFDLMDVAEEFHQRAKNNVDVHIGIDKGNIETLERVKAVQTYLNGKQLPNLNVKAVASVGLNHMKVLVRDPGTPNAATLILSGNLTQSCIGPEGDLKDLPVSLRPPESVPNANHAVLVKGQAPAIYARHQLQKVLVQELYGQSGFPIGGAYKFYEAPQGVTARVPEPWMILSFSPNGGMGDINNDILKQVILSTHGPIRFLQFAFSSQMIIDALATRVKNDRANGYKNVADFGGLGDTIFAMRDFSVFLGMAGLQMDTTTKTYSPATNALVETLTPQELETIRKQTYIAPANYGEKTMTINGVSYKTSGKIHHKVMVVPDHSLAIAGTSFNFSQNAEGNNEQVAVFKNEKVAAAMTAAIDWLESESKVTVLDLATKRNVRRNGSDLTAPACRRIFL